MTSSGQRKYELALDSDSESDIESPNSEFDSEPTYTRSSRTIGTLTSVETVDNSIRLWSIPGAYAWYVNGQRWNEADMATGHEPSTEADSEGAAAMDVVVESTESLQADASTIEFTSHSGLQ